MIVTLADFNRRRESAFLNIYQSIQFYPGRLPYTNLPGRIEHTFDKLSIMFDEKNIDKWERLCYNS